MKRIISGAGFRAKYGLPAASGDLKFPPKWKVKPNKSRHGSKTKVEGVQWTMTEYIREFERLNGLRSESS